MKKIFPCSHKSANKKKVDCDEKSPSTEYKTFLS